MSSNRERGRLGRSLALRLGLWHAALFGIGAAVVFVAVYVLLARALDAREREALEVRAAEYADAFETGGVTAVHGSAPAAHLAESVASLEWRALASRDVPGERRHAVAVFAPVRGAA